MSNFEVVFKTCLESMHEVNEQKMGKMLADMMQLGFVEMKPVFEIFYNQGVEDGNKNTELSYDEWKNMIRSLQHNQFKEEM